MSYFHFIKHKNIKICLKTLFQINELDIPLSFKPKIDKKILMY